MPTTSAAFKSDSAGDPCESVFRRVLIPSREFLIRLLKHSTSRISSVAHPAFNHAGIEIEQIQTPADRLIDNIVDSFRLVVECRNGRHNDGAVLSGGEHATQVAGMQWCLAHHKYEPAPFLESDVGCST